MKVVIHSISNMVQEGREHFTPLPEMTYIHHLRQYVREGNIPAPKMTRFDMKFSSEAVSGEAFLYLVNADWPIEEVRDTILSRELDLKTSVDNVRDVVEVEQKAEVRESITPLGLRGHFEIVATLMKILRSGEGAIGEACGASFCLYVDDLPPAALEISEGCLFRFKTEKLCFWLV